MLLGIGIVEFPRWIETLPDEVRFASDDLSSQFLERFGKLVGEHAGTRMLPLPRMDLGCSAFEAKLYLSSPRPMPMVQLTPRAVGVTVISLPR